VPSYTKRDGRAREEFLEDIVRVADWQNQDPVGPSIKRLQIYED